MNRATYIGHLALLRGRGGKSVKTEGLTLLTKVSFLLSELQNLADISTWPSEWHVLRSFCRAGDRRWEKRNRWTASPRKHTRAVYFYSIFFEGVKDTLMAGISLIQSDVDLSWSLIKKKYFGGAGIRTPDLPHAKRTLYYWATPPKSCLLNRICPGNYAIVIKVEWLWNPLDSFVTCFC